MMAKTNDTNGASIPGFVLLVTTVLNISGERRTCKLYLALVSHHEYQHWFYNPV